MYPLRIKEKYDQANLSSLGYRFSVVYLWTYKDGDYVENVWSHPWVDIIPQTTWQDVLACLDGRVLKVWEDGAYWKFIFIEHSWVPDPDDLTKTTTLYSCHEHLSKIKVNIWDIIKEGIVIWNTWNTWNSFWEHLHFQIDKMTAPFHAYWPFTWTEAKAAWTSFTWAVNIWLGLDKARMYTVNPLVYLDKVDNYRNTNNNTPESIIKPEFVVISPETSTVVSNTVETTPIVENKINIVSSNNDVLVSDPSLNILSSLSEEQKKNKLSDISINDVNYAYIMDLFSKWYIVWYSDGTFKPNNPITKTEFLKMLFLIKWVALSNDNTNYFIDVASNSWQKKYVNTAVELKIVTTWNKRFNTDWFLTRVEALKMAITLFVWEINLIYSKELSDVCWDEWYAKYVEYAIDNDLLSVVDNCFFPTKNITRYEFVNLLKKLS